MISSRRGQSNQVVDEENPYWISFSDIMAGLLIVFILAVIVLIIELMEIKTRVSQDILELEKAEKARASLLHEIVGELKTLDIPVELSDNDTVLRIPENVLTFDSAKFDINTRDKQRVSLSIGKIVYQAIVKEERWQYLDTIFIEGHTDNVPYPNSYLKGNLGLSTFRAISIWEHWSKKIPAFKELKNHNGAYLFSVSGYAETRPVQEVQKTAHQRRINRRIDIRFTVKKPSMESLKSIKGQLE